MGKVISGVFADQRAPLADEMKMIVKETATEATALFQQLNGLDQQKSQLVAALAINTSVGNRQAVDQIEQQLRMIDQALDKAYLLLADKIGVVTK